VDVEAGGGSGQAADVDVAEERALVGKRVQVFWDGDGIWYNGKISAYKER